MAQALWWLTDTEATRLPLDAGGVLIGRSPGCDLVLRDPKASRSQALVYLAAEGPRMLVLGRGRTLHNGQRIERDVRLSVSDSIEFPGVSLTVRSTHDAASTEGGWVLERPSGGFFGVPSGPFVIGGHGADDLQLSGWPEHALTLHLTQRRMHLLAGTTLEVDGLVVSEGALVPLSAGSRIAYAGQILRVITGKDVWHGSTVASTSPDDDGAVPERVRLEFLPRGCRLRMHAGGAERSVYLPGQRSELMAILLKPPAPYEVGQTLEDDFLITRLWPKQTRSRLDLNTLIYRLRKDLVRAGIDASGFVVRAEGGGGTRVGLASGAQIEIA
jgi:hypothetical protein